MKCNFECTEIRDNNVFLSQLKHPEGAREGYFYLAGSGDLLQLVLRLKDLSKFKVGRVYEIEIKA